MHLPQSDHKLGFMQANTVHVDLPSFSYHSYRIIPNLPSTRLIFIRIT